jgi:ABC-type oligopeptide transport system ATPase subunit
MSDAERILLEGRDLHRHFGGGRRWFGGKKPVNRAVDGVSVAVERGRTLGVVGESGCGKSTLARMLVGLLEPTSGSITLEGKPVLGLKGEDKLDFHRKVQMVFQDPLSSLNPRKTVRQILEGPLQALLDMSKGERADRVEELMRIVSLRPEFVDRYPHEFSGGQCQRIGIARALAPNARLVVLDEPVSALDVSVQAQVLNLLRDLQQGLGLTYVFISHDLAVVEALSDRVMVMYFGKVVEDAERKALFARPQHDYTKVLLAAVPVPGERRAEARAG